MSQPEHNCQMNYIELPATDLAATKQFYSQVFGWTFTDWGPTYVSFKDGRWDGGFNAEAKPAGAEAGAPTRGVLVVIYATSLDDIRRKVQQAGGKVIRDIFEFPGGKRFHFADPNGNELAVWSE